MAGSGSTAKSRLDLEKTDEPLGLSLRLQAEHLRTGAVRPFCPDVGRRLLRAEDTFPQWVLRRVETVTFQGERNVLREVTIELRVPDDAPVFGDGEDEEKCWLVPLTIMWRRTLVDFHLSDATGEALTLPGLRLTQALDQSILLAAAAAAAPEGSPPPEEDTGVREFVNTLVHGRRAEVESVWKGFDERTSTCRALRELRDVPAFFSAAERLRGGFSLLAFLPCSQGRHRLLKMSFAEPLSWKYQRPWLRLTCGVGWEYDTGPHSWFHGAYFAAALGLTATRLRLQVPAAEHAGSYHLEVKAPPGVRIGEAFLLAGEPGGDPEKITCDHVQGSALMVGLHGVEVPHGSLCRAQLHMRVESAGWLAVTMMSTIGVFLALWVAATHTDAQGDPRLAFVSILMVGAAAAATFIAQREHGTLAAKLLTLVRLSALLSTALLVVGAGFLVFRGPGDTGTAAALRLLMVPAGLLVAHLVVVWGLSVRMEQRQVIRSPWDMTPQVRLRKEPWMQRHLPWVATWWADLRFGPTAEPGLDEPRPDLMTLVRRFGFDRPALGIRSAEAWHRTFHLDPSRRPGTVAEDRRADGTACGQNGTFVCPRSVDSTCRAVRVSEFKDNVAAEQPERADLTPSAGPAAAAG